jgi:hypothetical protein
MCSIPSLLDATYDTILFGTSTGKVYKYQPATGLVTISLGKDGSDFTSEIRAITTDPGSLFVFVGVPGNNALCRYRTTDVIVNNQLYTISGTSNSNIYTNGDNTGGIAVNSQGEVFFVNQSGGTISSVGNYGYERTPTVQYSDITPTFVPDFRTLQFQSNENRLFIADNKLGIVYYYDFVKDTGAITPFFQYPPNQNPLSFFFDFNNNLFSTLATEGFVTVRTEGNNLYTVIAGGGTELITTDPNELKIVTPRAIIADNVGNLFFPSDISGSNSSYLFYLSFEFVQRAGVTNFPPKQKTVDCGLPAPGNCKKPAPTFNPREFWGWGSPNRKFLTPDPNLGCTLTPYVACATILRLPIPPDPPPPPPVVIPPVIPTEIPTLQFSERRVSLSPTPLIAGQVITILDISGSGELVGAPAIGPLGEVFVGTSSGNLIKYTTYSDTYFPREEWTRNLGAPITVSPSVSRKGVVGAFAGNTLYSLNPSGAILWSCNLPAAPAGSVAFDGKSLIAAYGQYLGYFLSNGQPIWINQLQDSNEYFTVSPLIYASVVLVGTNLGTMYCFDRDGNNLWGYNTATGFPITTSPVPLTQNTRVVFANGAIVYAINTQNPRKPRFDILCDISSITSIQSSPVAVMDTSGGDIISRIFFTADNCNVWNIVLSNDTILEVKSTSTADYEPTFSTSFSASPKLITVASRKNTSGYIYQLNMDLSRLAAIDLSDKYVNSESVLLSASRRIYALANSPNLCNGYLVTLYGEAPIFPPTNFVARRPVAPPPTPPAPDAPTNFQADGFKIASRSTISLVWDSAYRGYGSPVSGYTLTISPADNNGDTTFDVGLFTAYTVENLRSITSYTFTLTAYNEDGGVSDSVTTTAQTPSSSGPLDPVRPGIGRVTSSTAELSWASGSPGGGSAVTGYEISWDVNTNYGYQWYIQSQRSRNARR